MIAFCKKPVGVSVVLALIDAIPEPTHTIQYGKHIPLKVMVALGDGEVVLALDENGMEYCLILMDEFGTIRMKLLRE